MNERRHAYYPPRAPWHSPLRNLFWGLSRRLHLESMRLPLDVTIWCALLSVVIPGYAWAAHGQRTTARVIYGCYALAAVVFIIWLGHLVAACAFGVMVSLHVSGVLHLIGRQSLKLDLRWRMLLSLVAFSAVYLCIYRPLQNQFERRLALPLRVGQKVVI